MSNENEVEDEPIEIRLDQEVWDSLIEIFVRTKLSKESLKVYNEYLAIGDSVAESLSRAAINEIANIVLADKLARDEFAEAIQNNNKEGNNDTDKNSR